MQRTPGVSQDSPPAPAAPPDIAQLCQDLSSIGTAEEAAEFFGKRGFRTVDNRGKGGALWVFDPGRKLGSEMAGLRKQGVRFAYSQKRRGWYLA